MTSGTGMPEEPPAGSDYAEFADVETSSEEYAGRFSGRVGEYFLEVQARTALELLFPWPGARVLDVGGGHAQVAVPLARRGYRVTVQGSSEACRVQFDRLLPEGGVEFVRSDMLDLPFPDRHFDAVTAFRLLPHVGRWRELIREMCRVAGETVVVDYPEVRSFNSLQGLLFPWKKAIERNTRPYRCFRRRELLEEFARHGFGQSLSRPQFFFPMVVHRAAGRAALSRCLEASARVLGLTRAFGSPVVLRVVRPS